MRNSSNYKNFILFSVKAINVLCCCIIVFSLITSNSRKRSEIVQLKIPLNLKLQNQCYQCKNNSIQKNIFFLKTHKTASTTVQNIIMRFGYKHSLNFLLPKKHNYIGYYDPITESDMDENAIPLDRKFNIFTHHTKYRNSTDQFLYKNTIKVTILRNPPELFESLFTFYKFKKKYNITFQEFLISLPRIKIDGLKKGKKFGYNQMCRDLGLQPELQRDETAIRKFITKIDKEFDLVMIKEHLEGSLVLLKNLMGWPLEYVSFIPLNSRTDTIKYKLSEMDRFILSQMNYADTLLYEHFANKIRSCIVKYGENHLLDEVQKLYIINENLKNRCIQETDLKGYAHTISYILKNNLDWECIYSTKSELQFTRELLISQINRIKITKRLNKFINEANNLYITKKKYDDNN